MAKAIAISLENPFVLALKSSHNLLKAIIDFMYGTRERANYTYAFALGLAVLAGFLNVVDTSALMVCGHDTLTGAL